MMKIFNFFLFLLLFNGCYSQQKMDTITINYEAVTRGSSIILVATSSLITYKDFEIDREIKPSSKEWETLIQLLNDINLSNIKNLTSPSSNSAVDAALQATLSIAKNSTTYTSQTFDHGNPPKELKPVLEKIFSILKLM